MRTEGGERAPACCRVAAVVVCQPGERLGHERGDGGVTVNGEALDPLQKLAREAERDILVKHDK